MELLHFLGLCPDSLSHIDILDLVFVNYYENISLLKLYLKTRFFSTFHDI